MSLDLHPSDIAEAKRLNRKLAWMPKFRPRGRIKAALMQGAMKVMQMKPQSYLKRLGVTVETRHVEYGGNSVSLRILRPDGPPRGIYLDIHGGAWIVGNARCDDPCNAMIAVECGMAVVSVDYHLALDNRLDLSIRDCRDAAFWLVENCVREFGTDCIVIGGESAGAHLAACTLLAMRDRGLQAKIAGAVLFYGVFDLSGSRSLRAAGPETLVLHGPSAFSNLKRLTADRSEAERRRPDISPLYADLRDLPPALFLVGALDPLLDDTLQMAERWQSANVNVERVVVPEAPHAFNRLNTGLARKANAYVRRWVACNIAATASRRVEAA
ncbi:alpha/beta hydrolase [Chelativorans sp. M5D2P16]|uniref:alpha/beta hydrolase n=1 Tax=Chelativorans sp. M5D2P16 TaxID=3095678 RepID=UPI002ACA594B|nr:alpha/beta hydrolase [Chelativorans sp. M5D2P16]MDZ5695837.1 alpha/beta hydrolase [Chelativorans sp. M5D2P16]